MKFDSKERKWIVEKVRWDAVERLNQKSLQAIEGPKLVPKTIERQNFRQATTPEAVFELTEWLLKRRLVGVVLAEERIANASLLLEVRRLGEVLGWLREHLEAGRFEEAKQLMENTNLAYTDSEGGQADLKRIGR